MLLPSGCHRVQTWTIGGPSSAAVCGVCSTSSRVRERLGFFYTEFLPLLHETKAEVLAERDDDSYYLVYLGTKASARGKGYARKLIEHGLRMADAAGCPTYLESSADVNVAYYQKLGFVLQREIRLQRAQEPITLHIMVKEPSTEEVRAGSSKLKGEFTLTERPLST